MKKPRTQAPIEEIVAQIRETLMGDASHVSSEMQGIVERATDVAQERNGDWDGHLRSIARAGAAYRNALRAASLMADGVDPDSVESADSVVNKAIRYYYEEAAGMAELIGRAKKAGIAPNPLHVQLYDAAVQSLNAEIDKAEVEDPNTCLAGRPSSKPKMIQNSDGDWVPNV